MISTPDVASIAADAFATESSTTSSANIGNPATLSGAVSRPARSFLLQS
jgi:hypothetical protein